MLVSIFSRDKRMSAASFPGCHFCHTDSGKSPLLRGAASPGVLGSIWKAKLCFPRTPFSIGLQSFSQLPLHPCLCLRQGNARVPGWGGVSLMIVAAGECYPNRNVLCVVLQQVLTLLCATWVGKHSLQGKLVQSTKIFNAVSTLDLYLLHLSANFSDRLLYDLGLYSYLNKWKVFLFWTPGVVFFIKYVHSGENSKYGHELLRSSFFIKHPPLSQGKKKKKPRKMLKLPCTNDNKIWLPGTIPSSFTTIAFELLSMLCFSQGSCAFVHKPHVWWHWTFTCRYRLFKKGGKKENMEKLLYICTADCSL